MDKNLENKEFLDEKQNIVEPSGKKLRLRKASFLNPKFLTIAAVVVLAVAIPLTVLLATQKSPASSKSSASSGADIVPSQDVIQQGTEDVYYAGLEKDFLDKHPWYNSIPEANNDYFIGFDPITEEFFIDLYPHSSSSVAISIQTTTLKSSVTSVLRSIGVDTSKYKVSWSAYPDATIPVSE